MVRLPARINLPRHVRLRMRLTHPNPNPSL